jgi:hypothetical protein
MLRALDPLSCLVKGDLVFQLKGLERSQEGARGLGGEHLQRGE